MPFHGLGTLSFSDVFSFGKVVNISGFGGVPNFLAVLQKNGVKKNWVAKFQKLFATFP